MNEEISKICKSMYVNQRMCFTVRVGIKAEAAAPSQVTGLKQVGDSSSKIAISWNIPVRCTWISG